MSKLKRFSHAEIKKMSERDELSDGNYAFLLTGFKRVEEEGKPYTLALTFNPLEDPNDADSKHRLGTQVRLCMGESESSGPVQEFRLLESAKWAAAMLPDQKEVAVWNKGAKKWCTSEEEMDSEAGNEYNAEIFESALAALQDAYEDESDELLNSLVGQAVVYGTVSRSVAKSGEYAGRTFVNVRNPRRALRDGESLVEPGNFVAGKGDKEEAEKPAAKKAVAKKPVAKAKR